MSLYYLKNGELIHYGILGMKWGKRKSSTPKDYGTVGKDVKIKSKDIKKEQRKLAKRYYDKADKTELNKWVKEIDQLYKDRMSKKYDFDLDDGGGGSNAASRKAGARYMKAYEELEKVDDRLHAEAGKKAKSEILKKYGQTRMDKIQKQDVAKGIAIAATFMAVPAATVTGLIVSDLRK